MNWFPAFRVVRHLTLLLALGLPATAWPQGLFSPAVIVDADAITYYELEQRIQFMRVLRLPGNPEKTALEDLINDRLKQAVLRDAGLAISDEAVEEAMGAFAGRLELKKDEFVKALAQEGIDEETLRDYVKINLEWRDFISAQYLGIARPTAAEIDRAVSQQSSGGLRVLLSEIIIPIDAQNFEAAQVEAERISLITSYQAFSAEAQNFSATESRLKGGRLDWLPLNDLPPAMRPVILALKPGEVTSPLPIPNALALFQMRDIQETSLPPQRYSEIEYAVLYIQGGRSPELLEYATWLKGTADTCNDLYGAAIGHPADALFRDAVPPSKIPRDIAIELAKLDEGETSSALTTRDGRLMFIMLCSRFPVETSEEEREQVAIGLTQQRLESLSNSFVDQLRANATIIEK